MLLLLSSAAYCGVGKNQSGSYNLQSGNFNLLPENSNRGEDYIINSKLFTSGSDVRGIAAAIEQRGTNAGRIWALVVYSTDVNFPDTFKVYYSVDGGQAWQYFWGGNIRPLDKVNYNDP